MGNKHMNMLNIIIRALHKNHSEISHTYKDYYKTITKYNPSVSGSLNTGGFIG